MTAAAEPQTTDVPVPTGLIVDLRSWMQKWAYTPGLQFVRLSRLSPAEYPPGSRQSIAGDLEDLMEPLDSNEIAARWGGGVYTVSAIQASDQNARRVVERKRIELAGPPRAVPGHDGQPVPITSATAAASMAQPTLPGGGNVIDLNAALGRVAQQAQESQSVAALQQAHREARAELSQLTARHQAEVAELRKEMRANATDRDAPAREALAAQQRQFDRAMEAHQVQLDALRAQYESQTAALLRTHEKAQEAREASHQTALTALRDQHRNELEQVRGLARVEVETLRNDLNRERAERDRDNRDMRSQVDTLRAEAASAGDRRANEARETAKTLYEPQLTQLRAELVEARRSAETARAEARADAEKRERDVRAQLEAVNTAKESAIRSTLEARIVGLEADVRSRDERLARQDDELAMLRQQVATKGDPLEQIKSAFQFKDMITNLGGGPPQPQGFLQSLAQVAGPLRENLFEPVLKRVDRAVDVASQESARRAEAQAALLGNRGAQRAQVARQLGGPASQPRMTARRHVRRPGGRPQAAPAGAAPAQATTPPPSANPANRTGAMQILQQLEAWMNDGTAPASAVAQIKTAAQSGLVPMDVLQGIVNTPTRDLVVDVQKSAEQLNLSSLASPRGEEFIVALHRLLRA